MPDEVHEEASAKRRMPATLKPYLLRIQGGKMYLPAAYRVVWLRDECPQWGITTSVTEGGQEAGFATVMAVVSDETGRTIATAHKTETKADFPAGWVEKAETGAVARALSFAGFGTQFSDDLDEGRLADSPQPVCGKEAAKTGVWQGPGQCPSCHAPEGKRHGKPCVELLLLLPAR